jgi:DNA polymerase-3 subunit alpha
MPALAISDHGNMFGAFEFVAEAYKHKDENGKLKVKPVVGSNSITQDRHRKTARMKRSPSSEYCWQGCSRI